MKKYLKIFVFLIVMAATCPARADITVALVAPLTGSSAVFGEQLRRGAEQAIADINQQGGVQGQKLVLKEFDDACDPKQAVTVANQIVSQNIKFVVGHYCSGAALAAEKTFQENEIFVISPAVSHPKFTEDADTFVFRVGMRGDLQGQAIADYLAGHFKDKNIAILNDKTAYGAMIADFVKKRLNEKGQQEMLFDSYTGGERDYSTLVSLLKQKKTDIAVICGYHADIGLITRQLHQQDANVTVMGPVVMATKELWSITGKTGEGMLMIFGPDPRKRVEAKAAVESLKKSGSDAEGFTIYAYGAVQVIAQGIAAAHGPDTRAVAAALRKGTYPTVIGDLRFDAKGDVQDPKIAVYKWHDGHYDEVQ